MPDAQIANGDNPKKRLALYLPGFIVMAAVAACILSWTDNSIELTPDHSAVTIAAALLAGAAGAAGGFALLMWLNPPMRGPRWFALPMFALMLGLMSAILASFALERALKFADFVGKPTRMEQQFLINRAYILHGKGTSYHIQLSEYFADLDLSRDDYERTFGNADDVRPNGYCLRAEVEQNGQAVRILYPSMRPIPPRRVARCTSNVTDSDRSFKQRIVECNPVTGLPRDGQSSTKALHEPAGHLVLAPDWLQKPSGRDLYNFYPERALKAHVAGHVLLQCTVGLEGWARQCAVRNEAPTGYGFGDAAIRLIASSRFIPRRVDCAPTDGATVIVPLTFAN